MIKASLILTLVGCVTLYSIGLFLADEHVSFVDSREVKGVETAEEVICIFCSATVLGRVEGDVITIFGSQRIEGSVSGDAIAVGGDVYLKRGAEAKMDILSIGGTVRLESETSITQPAESIPYLHFPGQRSLLHVGILIAFVAHMTLILLVAALLRPHRIGRLAEVMTRNAWTCLAIGLPLGAAWVFLEDMPEGRWLNSLAYAFSSVLILFWTLGYTAFGLLAGSRIRLPQASYWRQLLAGGFVMFLFLVVPVLGAVLWAVVAMASAGGTALTIGQWVRAKT